MNNVLSLALILTAICSAQVSIPAGPSVAEPTRMNPEEISAHIKERLESRGVRLEDVTRAVKEGRSSTHSTGFAVPANAASAAISTMDQKTLDRIVNTFNRLYQVYSELGALNWAPRLYYNTALAINAYATQGSEVHVYLALAELVRDSDSELAFAIAHELGHIVQQRENALLFVSDNKEFDADVWGTLISLMAGYDPYAGSGTLAKLSMATGDVGLAQQFEDQSSQDAHKSFVTRVEIMYNALKAVCGINADFQSLCDQYRSNVHPHFPANAVL